MIDSSLDVQGQVTALRSYMTSTISTQTTGSMTNPTDDIIPHQEMTEPEQEVTSPVPEPPPLPPVPPPLPSTVHYYSPLYFIICRCAIASTSSWDEYVIEEAVHYQPAITNIELGPTTQYRKHHICCESLRFQNKF